MRLLALFVCVSAYEHRPCITCKHFIEAANPFYGKCRMFPVVSNMDDRSYGYMDERIYGYSIPHADYNYCSTARTFPFMCAENGKHHEVADFTEMDEYS